MLQNFSNPMPVGAAVLTEVSASIRTGAVEHSPHPSVDDMGGSSSHRCFAEESYHVEVRQTSVDPNLNNGGDGISTRRKSSIVEKEPVPREPRLQFELGLLPRITNDALAANCQCYILHPDKGDKIVAEGRIGGCWKSPSQKFGNLCSEGHQMVQIHRILVPNLPLIFVEERQPFTMLEHALVKPSGSSVYVKWHSRLLHKKNKRVPPK
ncbi:hypothetical protein KC19_VG228300 [Ceratodon purpureus]|uniref:Uncharacterized protein n=1 Tax=Ceratodon purpureus TaxID=3225 RepID=A0A8T0HTD0_CERPU|nr:hypothetical protein KC19_VG228300 [Ceratodon purpureus]KAG0574018.1 hypothetical protein KC19_VG228300 [Ceratodon purpureus]KAG0574019.1 hypothetical protein KC19_VG228300 [Ceratodon purpureus]KAG0574020.1 hypothetical protein KC19_VG228300 [Ceratodon purpureus]KAG0574021.1 hypothetical protein KC19_VG228300 [Ceratodon purpureus]